MDEHVSDDAMEAVAQARAKGMHSLLTPDAQGGKWAGECLCGWGYVAEDDSADSEREVYQAFEMHAAAPDELWPRVGQEMLVDCSNYAHGMGSQWLRVTRVLPLWSAGVYPLKAMVPGRGEGQWKRSEVLDVQDPGGPKGLLLTRQVLDTLIAMFPEGCDVMAGRQPGHIHAQRPDEDETGYRGGVLLVHEGLLDGGCASLGITRNTYLRLPEASDVEERTHYQDEPGPR